jgi:hypothetical protein
MSNGNTMQNNTDLKNNNVPTENTMLDDVNDESGQKAHKWSASVLFNHGLLSTALTLLLGLGTALAIIYWPGTKKSGFIANTGSSQEKPALAQAIPCVKRTWKRPGLPGNILKIITKNKPVWSTPPINILPPLCGILVLH